MNTKTLPTTAEIVTAVLVNVADIAAASPVRDITSYAHLQDPSDRALVNAIYDLLDTADTEGRAEREEAAHVLLGEISEGAKEHNTTVHDLTNEVRRAIAALRNN